MGENGCSILIFTESTFDAENKNKINWSDTIVEVIKRALTVKCDSISSKWYRFEKMNEWRKEK